MHNPLGEWEACIILCYLVSNRMSDHAICSTAATICSDAVSSI
jgi:hypothetical protein